jgi:hypothetical protein
MQELRVEMAQERDERYKYLLFKGMPMPNGWQLPALIDPPEHSRPEALQRAAEEIQSLMQAEFDSWRRVPFDAGAAIEPGKSGRWGEMTEFGKLDIMQHWVNWEGVSLKDRATSMATHIDVNLLSPAVRTQLLADASGTGRPPDRDICAAAHEEVSPAESRPAGRSPLQHVREELKRWHGGKITAENRPGPWWNHPGWENEDYGRPEPYLLSDAIDWKGVSQEMKDRILEQWWKPFPEALSREHELNRLVEAAGGWQDRQAVERLRDSFIEQAATHAYESNQIALRLGCGFKEYVCKSDGYGYHQSPDGPTLQVMREDYHKRYAEYGIYHAYDMAIDGRRHLDLMRDRAAAILEAGTSMREGTPEQRHRWLVPGTWVHHTIDVHRRWLESGGTEGSRATLVAHNLRYAKFAGLDLRQADLRAADFYRADLQGVDFRGSDLRGVNFSRADCRGCDFADARLEGAVFHGTDLRLSTLEHADIAALTRPLRTATLQGRVPDPARRAQFQQRDSAKGLDR